MWRRIVSCAAWLLFKLSWDGLWVRSIASAISTSTSTEIVRIGFVLVTWLGEVQRGLNAMLDPPQKLHPHPFSLPPMSRPAANQEAGKYAVLYWRCRFVWPRFASHMVLIEGPAVRPLVSREHSVIGTPCVHVPKGSSSPRLPAAGHMDTCDQAC